MKIDYRKSQTPDLTKPFRDYKSHSTLVGWYKFNSKTSQPAFSNLSNSDMSAAQVEQQRAASTSIQIHGSPYVGETDDRSISFRENYFKDLEVSDSTSQFGNNPPFTIAGWFKIPNLAYGTSDGVNELLRKQEVGVTSTHFSWSVDYLASSRQIQFTVSGSHPTDSTAAIIISTNPLTTFPSGSIGSDEWFHFAATVSNIAGNAGSIPINGNVKVYLNGKIASLAGSAQSGTAAGGTGTNALIIPDFTPNNINGSVFVAKESDSSSAASTAFYSNVDVHELAFWRSALSSDEIYSLWSSARWWQGSGIVSDSPRNVIRARDNQTTLPTIDWPSIDRRIISSSIPYDDQATTRVFQTSSRPLTFDYPSMIPTVDADLRAKTVLTPNTHPQMTVNSGDGAGVYSEFQPDIKDDDPYNINTYFNIFFSPFNETRVQTNSDDLVLELTLPISSEKKLTRSITGSFPGYLGETSTGVFYYNLNTKRFDIIGNRDPLRSNVLIYTASSTEDADFNPNGLFAVARKRLGMFLSQDSDFLSFAQFGTLSGSDSWVTSSYMNIGQPTTRYGGPANIRLYATSSYILDMSEFINRAFLIEDIKLEISGSMVKNFDGEVSQAFPSDAYTFFLLRQTRERADTPVRNLVSSSYREIIGFKSVLSWNSRAEWSGSLGDTYGPFSYSIPKTYVTSSQEWFGNYSDFAVAHEYGVVDPKQSVSVRRDFNTSIDLSPRVAPAGLLRPIACFNTPPAVWGGSTANLGQTLDIDISGVPGYSAIGTPTGSIDSLDLSYDSNYSFFNDTVPSNRTGFPYAPTKGNFVALYTPNGFVHENDPPTRRFDPTAFVNLDTKYLLFPGDNLVLGIEALPSAPEAALFFGGPYPTWSTGSYLEIPVQEAKLIIKGRYLKNQEAYGAPFAQQLTTDAIHSSLHYDNPVLDQFEIEKSEEYGLSTRAIYITGSMTVPETGWPRFSNDSISSKNRRLSQGNTVIGTAGDEGSLQRNYRIHDSVEKYYDSFVPDIAALWKIDGYSPQLQVDPSGVIFSIYNVTLFSASPADQNENKLWLTGFPFESKFSSAARITKENASTATQVLAYELSNASEIYNSKDRHGGVMYSQDFNMIRGVRGNSETAEERYSFGILGTNQYASMTSAGRNIFFFGVGNGPYGIHVPLLRRDYSGSPTYLIEKPAGFKYGLISANPMGTSAVYRSTRYGQMRDMLEQRQYAALLIEQPENKSNIFEPKRSKSGVNKLKRVNKKEAPVRFPVTVKFREPVHENPTGLTNRSPINTQSSNISLYATSSLPFFDDDVPRNRDYPSGSV